MSTKTQLHQLKQEVEEKSMSLNEAERRLSNVQQELDARRQAGDRLELERQQALTR